MIVAPELIQRCLNEDRKAQFELYRLCFAFMMRICFRYTNQRADAEALLNQAFCKVLFGLEKYDSTYPFGAWLKRITVNTAIDEYRKNARRIETYPEDVVEEEFHDFDPMNQQFGAEELMHMVRELPEQSREIFNLYAIDGYMHKEISEMLGVSISASKWHVANARKLLKTRMVEYKKVAAK